MSSDILVSDAGSREFEPRSAAPQDARSHAILQLTDLHLFTDRARRLKGVPTWDSLEDVLRDARRRFPKPDLVVITGDIAHDELPSTYVALRETLGDWVPRCRFLPGNHDLRSGLRAAFPELFSPPFNAGTVAGDELLSFSLTVGAWRLIGLDTHIPGQVTGRLHEVQAEWLSGQLRDFSHLPTLLFQHHPPLHVGTPWVDALGHENPEELARVVDDAPQVAAIVTGHVHQSSSTKWRGTTVHTTPSTAVQFAPTAETFQVENVPPGYRVIELRDRDWSTRVVRLAETRFPATND